MNKPDIDVLLVTGGQFGSQAINLEKLLSVLISVTPNIFLVTRYGKDTIKKLDSRRVRSLPPTHSGLLSFVVGQLELTRAMLSIYRRYRVRTVMFAMGQDLQLIPMGLTKILGKKLVIRSDGRPSTVMKKYMKQGIPLKRFLFRSIEAINYRLANVLVTNCDFMVEENDFGKYKVQTGGSLFVDFDKFTCITSLQDREYDIGFVGRLSGEKGVMNLLYAIPLLNKNIKLIIIGDGPQRPQALSIIEANNLQIKYAGWIENDALPAYLNQIKILAVTSLKEGLPNVVLEAMACGCIVLATPVGGIPGLIKDGETGFLMETNSPECIAANISRVLNHPEIDEIAYRARAMIGDEFRYESVVEAYRQILV